MVETIEGIDPQKPEAFTRAKIFDDSTIFCV